MRIVVVSDHLDRGGAAIACNRLCEALAGNADTQVHRFTVSVSPNATQARFALTQGLGRRIEGFFNLTEHRSLARAASLLRHRVTAKRLAHLVWWFQPEVISLHNLHGADLPLKSIALALADKPVVWTLHDMWSFTGRCAYAYDCTQYVTGCGATCPTAGEYPALPPDRIASAWRAKQGFLGNGRRLAAACPSAWLAGVARSGLWAQRPVETIPNGLPLDVFYPVEKKAARLALNLPTEGLLGLIAADYLKERRKGGDLIAAALAAAAPANFGLVTMGHAKGLTLGSIPVHPLGYVSDDAVKRLAYSAADLLIHPAPVDNLPNTVVEALACGTPTAAFRTGGLPEMVLPGETGWLSERISVEDLADCLRRAFADLQGGVRLGNACRQLAEKRHSLPVMSAAYLDLFQRTVRPTA